MEKGVEKGYLGNFWQVWAGLGRFGQVWASWDKFGQGNKLAKWSKRQKK